MNAGRTLGTSEGDSKGAGMVPSQAEYRRQLVIDQYAITESLDLDEDDAQIEEVVEGPLSLSFCWTYLYLCPLTSEQLPSISSSFRFHQGSCRNLQIAKLFTYVYNRIRKEKLTVMKLFGEKEDWMFAEFLQQWESMSKAKVIPTIGNIRKTAMALEREDEPQEHASVRMRLNLKTNRGRSGTSGVQVPSYLAKLNREVQVQNCRTESILEIWPI